MTLAPLLLPTRSAHWGWDEHRYFGHKVFEELTGTESFIGLNALAVAGRRLPAECCGLLEDAAGALTLADPRIWPLKLTRVVASYGGVASAVAAGLVVQQSAQIGPWVCTRAAEVLVGFRALLGDRLADESLARELLRGYLAEHRFMWGLGTPFRGRDERLVAFRPCVVRRKRDQLPHWRTFELLSVAARELRGVEANIGLAMAAVCLDMGLEPDEIGPLVIALVSHMFVAHAVEGARQGPSVLKRLPEEYLADCTHPARESPRARASRIAGPRPPTSSLV